MSEITQSTVGVNDIEFTYLEAGTGPLALCLHGFPDTAWGWEPLLGELAQAGYHAVAPFMRGYAPTSVAPDGRYQTGALALDAIGLHDSLGGDGDAVLIGHDWGALATYGAATHAPDRWRRVVAASVPPASVIGLAMLDYDNLKQRFWYQFFFCNPMSDIAVPMNDLAFIDRLWADWSPGFDAADHVELVKQSLRDQANISAALLYYRHTLGGIDQDPDLADLQAATFQVPPVPALYLHGTEDGCMPCPETTLLQSAFQVEGSRVELVEHAGHFLQYERPDVFNRAVVDFLAS
jgi:pimeloyl-ACP methyl ester carboxylesterase